MDKKDSNDSIQWLCVVALKGIYFLTEIYRAFQPLYKDWKYSSAVSDPETDFVLF